MYASIGAPPPQFIWLDSPMAGLLVAGLLSGGDQLGHQLGDQLWDQLADQLWDQLRDQLGGQLGDQLWHQLWHQLADQLGGQLADQLGHQLWDQLADQLRDQLGDQLRHQLWDQLADQLGHQLRDQLRGQLRDQLGHQLRDRWEGQHLLYWAGWLAFAGHLGVVYPPALDAGLKGWLAASDTGWMWPYAGICICTERPVELGLDGAGRMHSETGMAMAYSDGWGFHAWHGTRVPEWVVMDPTLGQIAAEENVEIRRCAIESYGWDAYLASLGEGPVSTCADPGNPGQVLKLYDVPDATLYGGPVRLLVMTNGSVERDGTRRTYAETVPVSTTTALAGAAWRAGMTPDIYATLQRRT